MKLSFAKAVLYEVFQVQIKTVSCKSRMFFVLLWTSLTCCHLVVFKSVCCTDILSKSFIYLFNFLNFTIGFAIHQHESAIGVHVFPSWTPLSPPSPSHPSGSFQCTSPENPVSCIEIGLVIHFIYDIIHVSMPFSQIIPPSPSPTESKRLFYTSVSLMLSH